MVHYSIQYRLSQVVERPCRIEQHIVNTYVYHYLLGTGLCKTIGMIIFYIIIKNVMLISSTVSSIDGNKISMQFGDVIKCG